MNCGVAAIGLTDAVRVVEVGQDASAGLLGPGLDLAGAAETGVFEAAGPIESEQGLLLRT